MANAAGGDTPNTDTQTEQPQYLTARDAEALVSKVVNSAITSHFKRLDFGKMIGDALEARQPKTDDAAQIETPQAGAQKVDPELVKLRRDLEAQRKALENEQKARQEAEAARRNERALSELRGALGKHVRPEAVDLLTKAFRADLAFDDDGSPLLPIGDGQTTSIAAAVETWAKSKDAAIYLPAPTAGGSGSPRPNGSRVSFDALTGKTSGQLSDGERQALFAEQVRRNSAVG